MVMMDDPTMDPTLDPSLDPTQNPNTTPTLPGTIPLPPPPPPDAPLPGPAATSSSVDTSGDVNNKWPGATEPSSTGVTGPSSTGAETSGEPTFGPGISPSASLPLSMPGGIGGTFTLPGQKGSEAYHTSGFSQDRVRGGTHKIPRLGLGSPQAHGGIMSGGLDDLLGATPDDELLRMISGGPGTRP